MERPDMGRARLGSAWLTRGESVVASIGIALAAILLAVTVGSAGWTLYTHRNAMEAARRQQIGAVGMTLAQAAEGLLAAGELTALRRLVADAAIGNDLTICRIVLGDGRIAADADPSKIPASELPEQWEGQPAPSDNTGSAIALTLPIDVPGRGRGVLEVAAGVDAPAWLPWESEVGIGVIGVAGLAALWVVYRSVRRRLGALGAIREALVAAEAGETALGALRVSEALGSEAAAWNKLLEDREDLRKKASVGGGGDLGVRRGSDEGLYSACDAMWQGLLLIDDRLRVKYANGAAATFLGAKRELLIGSQATGHVSDSKVMDAIKVVAGGTSRQRATVEVRQRGDRGDCVLRFSVRPVRREDAAAAMVLIEDVTQQRVADEARNAFVAQATHELRTPLTNISLYVETLVEQGDTDAPTRAKCLNVIGQEVRRLERIVGDMLSVSQIEAGSLKLSTDDVRLDALFEEIEADYKAQAQDKDISLAFKLPPKLPVIHGDRDKITLAIHNLIGNALKYTPAGGEVTVGVEEAGGKLSVTVADNGIGIRDEELELIFEKFYRSSDKRLTGITGSGLGLALAREVARMHGGDITVRSQLNKGSSFTMTLPAAMPAAAGAALRAAA
jgi:signal transduction histidine kinase